MKKRIKFLYIYEDGTQKLHNDFVTKRTMLREGKESEKVAIYAYDEERETVLNYIAMIGLK